MGLEYHRNEDKIEIIIKDSTGAKIETLHCQIGDRKKYGSILRYLKDKYGFEPEVRGIDEMNSKTKEEMNWWE